MGLFGGTKYCPVCGEQVKGLANLKIKDNATLCQKCSSEVFFMDPDMRPFQSAEDIKEFFVYRNKNKEIFQTFRTSREFTVGTFVFRVDESQRLWYYNVKIAENPPIFSYDEIIDYELLENGETITKGGLGQAAVGAALFGGVGAIVGGITGGKKSRTIITSFNIRISLNNTFNKQIIINFLPAGIKYKSNSLLYNQTKNTAINIISLLDSMCHQTTSLESPNTSPTTVSPADEILKYKNLLDNGIITQEEFNQKKQQLLNL